MDKEYALSESRKLYEGDTEEDFELFIRSEDDELFENIDAHEDRAFGRVYEPEVPEEEEKIDPMIEQNVRY